MKIVSVSTDYPGPGNLARGLFVKRRLEALARTEEVRVVHLEPWFPWLRPRARGGANGHPEVPPAVRRPMFYLPGVLKGLDGRWLERAVLPALRGLEGR